MYTYGNYYNTTGFSTFTSFLSLVAAVITIVALWRIFVKAGKPGWHAIIPFLNIYDLFAIAWVKSKGVAVIILEAVAAGLIIIGMIMCVAVIGPYAIYGDSYFGFRFFEMLKYGSSLPVIFFIGLFLILVAAILAIVGAVMLMVCYYRLGKAFGRQGGFLVGMVLLPVVFMSIIAFSRDEYQGNYEGYAPNQGYNPYGQGGYGQGYNNQGYGNPGYGNPGYDNRMNNQQGYPGQAETPYNTQPYPQPGFDQTQAGSMGSTAGAAGAADISGASATDTANAAGTARFCRECGNRLQPGAKFCNNCGKPVL